MRQIIVFMETTLESFPIKLLININIRGIFRFIFKNLIFPYTLSKLVSWVPAANMEKRLKWQEENFGRDHKKSLTPASRRIEFSIVR